MSGCAQRDYFTENGEELAEDLSLVGFNDPQTNEVGYILHDFDVKEVEVPENEELPSYDFDGPRNAGVKDTSSAVTNPVSTSGTITATSPVIYLVVGHDANKDPGPLVATSKKNEDKIIKKMQNFTWPGESKKLITATSGDELEKQYKEALIRVGDKVNEVKKKIRGTNKDGKKESIVYREFIEFFDGELAVSSTPGVDSTIGGTKYYEYQETYKLCEKLYTQLTNKGYIVILNRSGMETVDSIANDSRSQALAANSKGASLVLSIHMGCVEHYTKEDQYRYNTHYDGIAAYHNGKDKAKSIAKKIVSVLDKADYEVEKIKKNEAKNGFKSDNGVKKRARYPLMGWSDSAAIALSVGSLSNIKEGAELIQDDKQDLIAKKIADAIAAKLPPT